MARTGGTSSNGLDLSKLGTVTSPSRFPPGSFVEEIWRTGKFCLTGYVGRHSIPDLRFPDELRDRVPLGPATTLEIKIFDELRHNAVAFRKGSAYTVGLYHGLIMTVPAFASALWVRPDVAPWIGDVSSLPPVEDLPAMPAGLEGLELERILSGEEFESADHERLLAENRARSARIVKLVSLLDPVRRAAMQQSIADAFRFVWLHEIGHVVWGHLDLVEKGSGALGMSEVDDYCGDALPPELGQYLEFQTDRFAFGAVLGYRISDVVALSADGPAQVPGTAMPTHVEQATIAIMGCLMTQLIFAANLRVKGRPDVAGTHPPIWLRVGDMINEARNQCGTVDLGGGSQSSAQVQQYLADRMAQAVRSIVATHPVLTEIYQGIMEGIEGADPAYADNFDSLAPQWDAMVRPHHKFYRAEGGGLALRD